LDKGHITFGTLTRAIRINDRVIKAWSQILKRVKHSKLVINSADFSHYKTKRMIISKFEEYGIKQNRLEVGYQSPPWDTMRQIDIALDCFPHNSGTTLIEHLYMGNPFVTYSNRPSVGKIGASILTALGREEWIAYSEQEYIDKAVALATDTKKLASIRSSLREEMKRSPIMDHKGFVRELERTYQSMWDKWCADSEINLNI
jgi:predicted O-linked N-acetylglucosamine transferase (SPINDLY family)